MNLKRYILINLENTDELSLEILELLKKGKSKMVFLEGDLGVGKTTLVQHVLKNLGIKERVKSPTYTLIEPYQTKTRQKIYHLDLYRLNDERELEHLGLDDLIKEHAIFFVEWPEKLKAYGISPDVIVRLSLLSDGRREVELDIIK